MPPINADMNTIVAPGRDARRPDELDTHAAKANAVADDDSPFVFNCWYIAAMASEVQENLLDRWILGTNILIYRGADGRCIAVQNRCPHRSAPLSMGRRHGDDIECAYHGLRFSPSGECIFIPSQRTIPNKCRLQSYAVRELGPHLWIFMGDPAVADEYPLPDAPWLHEPGHGLITGYFHVDAGYLKLHDNVLDLSHVPYLHGTHNATTQFAEIEPDTVVENDRVITSRSERDRDTPPHYAASISATIGRALTNVNRHTRNWFESPAIHLAETRIEDTAAQPGERRDYVFQIAHAFTPETAHSTHYFWANGRDTSIGNAQVDETIRQRSLKVYHEDVVILEAAEALRLRADDPAFQEFSFVADKAGFQMRRIVARLAAQERGR